MAIMNSIIAGWEHLVSDLANAVPYTMWATAFSVIILIMISGIVFWLWKQIIGDGKHMSDWIPWLCMGTSIVVMAVYMLSSNTVIARNTLTVTDSEYDEANNTIVLQLEDKNGTQFLQMFNLSQDSASNETAQFSIDEINTGADIDSLDVEQHYNGNYSYYLNCKDDSKTETNVASYLSKTSEIGTGNAKPETNENHTDSYRNLWLYAILF